MYFNAITILRRVATIIPIIPMIWNLNTNNWEAENRTWNS